jgi:hypothetical protein
MNEAEVEGSVRAVGGCFGNDILVFLRLILPLK